MSYLRSAAPGFFMITPVILSVLLHSITRLPISMAMGGFPHTSLQFLGGFLRPLLLHFPGFYRWFLLFHCLPLPRRSLHLHLPLSFGQSFSSSTL